MEGKVVLITGASSGIGAGTAVRFASKGCLLSLTGRNVDGLKDTLLQCVSAGAQEHQILLIPADLGVEEDIKKIMEQTIEKFEKLDILVNNAGLGYGNFIEQVALEEFDTIMKVNLRAVFHLMQLAIPHLIMSKGNVVNVSSVASSRPTMSLSVYGMSKTALDYLSRCAALELAPHKVRVNTINPGYVYTNIDRHLPIKYPDAAINACHALGRAGTVEEMAKAILFLADEDQSSFITGTSLLVDGGNLLLGPIFKLE